MNYFHFFEIPMSFQVDESALRRAFYQNSKKFHPDFHTLADEAQQADMLEQATINNEAYRTLADPDQRIRYVLQLKGLLGDETQNPALPPAFLMEIMDINEALMELEFDFDPFKHAVTLDAVKKIEDSIRANAQNTLENWSETNDNPLELKKVLDFYLKMKYLLRIRENLHKFAPS